MVARVVPVEPFDLVVFGATGDLARRKLIPALYHRMEDGQMPAGSQVIGAARSEMDDDGFRALAGAALDEFVGAANVDAAVRERFLGCLRYVALDATSDQGWERLRAALPDAAGRPRKSR
ncbi:MAG TPA: hypothetical protein VLA52_12215 [Thermohalobaculum sp.]|nr:hypothetical protein [Thermohalobaculum sp.]